MIIGYPTPGKDKARIILDAFCSGANQHGSKARIEGHAFYGIVKETRRYYDLAKYRGEDVYYLDNAYFDTTREVYFRATRNRLQHIGDGQSDGKRFDSLQIPIKPWRTNGSHVLICPQSDQFMHDVVGYEGDWLQDTLRQLRKLTDRPLRVRPWSNNKQVWYKSLPDDLKNCWCLVAFSSASAITAILNGIPAISTADDAIASQMGSSLSAIEQPYCPPNRREWAGVVADNQWTLEEMRYGICWRMLQEMNNDNAKTNENEAGTKGYGLVQDAGQGG